jgi:hypothetical protein
VNAEEAEESGGSGGTAECGMRSSDAAVLHGLSAVAVEKGMGEILGAAKSFSRYDLRGGT